MRDITVKLLEEVEANKLPTLPHILVKLVQACREEEVCFDTLSELISQDASLCTKVMKAANSPVYGRARNLNSLKQTLLFLGLDTIKSIAITASIKQFFSEYSVQKTSFLKQFWQHSLSCATTARSLAELTSYPYIEEAYIGGLLHDIGKLMLEPMMDSQYVTLDHGGYATEEILSLEHQAFGLDHTELAAALLEKWHLPDVVCDAIRYHHAPVDSIKQAHHLARIINLANLLTSDAPSDIHSAKIDAAIQLFDLSEAVVNRLLEQAEDSSHDIARSMGIDIGESAAIRQKDETRQIELAQEVRDNALVMGTQLNEKLTTSELYRSIQQSINLLFGFDRSLVLKMNDAGHLVVAENQAIPESQLFNELKINPGSDSVISRCINDHKISDSFSAQASGALCIIDEQIIRGFKLPGFICVPVSNNRQINAVLLLACEQSKGFKTLENRSLLCLFADNIAQKIHHHSEYVDAVNDVNRKHHEDIMQRARRIVHETNNPLSVIRNYLQLLSQKLDSDDPAQGELQTIKQEIDRIANIILRCKDSQETDDFNLSKVDINQLITELMDVYKASLFTTHNIRSVLKLDREIGKIQSDRDIIKQIITNLVKNAVEAMVNDGEIVITTGNINIDGTNFIELKLQDTGNGIPLEVMKSLYKPVTSTKGKAHSGLGLSITKNLVNRIGGSISCRTGSTGTVFSIQLPEET